MSLILVVVSAISYWELGANQQINLKQLSDERMQDRASLELFLTEYKSYLHKQDKDVSGWWLVARNYFTVGEFAQAEAAYREALAALQQFSEVNPEDHAEVLTKLAQSIFFQNDDFNDEVKSLLEQAISLNPNQTIALGLLGIGSFKTAVYLSAIKYWL